MLCAVRHTPGTSPSSTARTHQYGDSAIEVNTAPFRMLYSHQTECLLSLPPNSMLDDIPGHYWSAENIAWPLRVLPTQTSAYERSTSSLNSPSRAYGSITCLCKHTQQQSDADEAWLVGSGGSSTRGGSFSIASAGARFFQVCGNVSRREAVGGPAGRFLSRIDRLLKWCSTAVYDGIAKTLESWLSANE